MCLPLVSHLSEIAVQSLVFTVANPAVAVGRGLELEVTAVPSFAMVPVLTWASASPGVATVSQAGVVIGVSVGVAVITATAANGVCHFLQTFFLAIAFATPLLLLRPFPFSLGMCVMFALQVFVSIPVDVFSIDCEVSTFANIGSYPVGVTGLPDGTFYMTDYGTHRISRVTSDGVVTIFAGSSYGFQDGTGTEAQFYGPVALDYDPTTESLFVAEEFNHCIRKVVLTTAAVSTFAGTCTSSGSQDGVGLAAGFSSPLGLAVDRHSGVVYVSDYGNRALRKITPGGTVTTLATGLEGPHSLAVAPNGMIFVADHSTVRKVDPSTGQVTIWAGTGATWSDNGPAASATFSNLVALTLDPDLNVIVMGNDGFLRMISSTVGEVSTLAGYGAFGYADGPCGSAKFHHLVGLALNPTGAIVATDYNNHLIRKITQAPVPTRIVVNPTSVVLGRGVSALVVALVHPVVAGVSQAVNWSSSDSSVVAVNSSGGVTGMIDGVAFVTATSGALSASTTVTGL